MQYFGGKHRIARKLVEFMPIHPSVDCIEPFVGAASVVSRVGSGQARSRQASDLNPALISLWQAVQQGWNPPASLSEEEYQSARGLSDGDPIKAFAGFGLSFAGKWFGGYARNSRGHNYAGSARSSLLRMVPLIDGVVFSCIDYRKREYPSGAVVYCDPPYQGTTQYQAVEKFDWGAFWGFYAELSQKCFVFVSEYQAPKDWLCALSIPTRTGIRTAKSGCEPRIEKLWCHKDGLAGACL